MKKEQLLSYLDQLIKTKKDSIPLFQNHISSSIAFSGLKEAHGDSIVEHFQQTVTNFRKHIELLEELKADLKESTKDVY